MSAIPLEGADERATSVERSTKLPPKALAYFLVVAAAAVAVTAPFLADFDSHTGDWLEFVLLATSVAVAQFFVVRTPGNKSYHTTGVFLIAAALLVSPALLALIPLIQHIPEWLRSRGTWYVQMTNIFVFTIATMSAWGAAHVISGADGLIASDDVRFALAGTAAAIVLVVLNSALIAPMIRLVNGHPMRQLFSYQTLSTEFVFAALGVILAAFWTGNPWLVPFAIAPLLLIHRALSVPQLQAEARVDPKTGLFNARYFASALSEELGRAERFERPLSLIMADLDLLREINNTYGHLAGDAVLKGIAEVFRAELRHYDVPARFGGEEFSILLPETPPEQAMEIAERIRRAVAEKLYDVETSSEPIRATVSIGVAGYPKDAQDPNALIHQADLAVYRAKLQGRNRVLGASSEPLLMPADRTQRLVAVPEEGDHHEPLARVPEALPEQERRHTAHTTSGPRFLQLSLRLGILVGLVSTVGIAAGIVGAIFGSSTDMIGLLAVIALVSVGEALALELDDGSISVSAVGALAGAALFGPRAALALAVAICVVQWSAQRQQIHRVLFNIGTLTLSSLAAAGVFMLGFDGALGDLVTVVAGIVAGGLYFAVNTGLLSIALAVEGRENVWRVWHERFLWLAPHYLVYGFIGGVIAIGYHAAGLYALAVFAVPLLLMRKTQEAYLSHTRRSAQKLRQAAETIHTQNVSLEQANRLLKERSTAAMESLSATVDARDAYTAGHSRRVQQLALAIGRELGLSQIELDLLGHAALFHDIGKLAIPDSILLKPASLTRRGVGADAAPRRRGSPHHRPPRFPRRCRACDPAPPRALRRHGLPRPPGPRGDPARRPHHPRRRRARLDADHPDLPRRASARGGPRRAPRRRRHPVLPPLRRRARAHPAARVAHRGRAAGASETARDLALSAAVSATSQGQTLGHVLFWRSCKPLRMLYTACMGRSRRHPAVAGIDPEALAAFQAGIRKRYTDEEILAQLTDSAERLGRSPTMREFAADPQTTVHPQTVIEHFGSWNAAKRQAGLVPRRFATREELLGRLRALGEELGRTPTARDIDARKGAIPSKSLLWHTFGSLAQALREAGFDVPVGEERLERAVEQGATLARTLGRLPKMADWAAARRADESLLTEWQVYRMIDVQPAWAAFQFLVRERLREEGVDVAPDGSLGAG